MMSDQTKMAAGDEPAAGNLEGTICAEQTVTDAARDRNGRGTMVPITFVLCDRGWSQVLHWGYLTVTRATAADPAKLAEMAKPLVDEAFARGLTGAMRSAFVPGHVREWKLSDGGYPAFLARLRDADGRGE